MLPPDAAVPPQPMTARHGQIIRERDLHLFFAGVGVARVHLALLQRRRVLVGVLVLVHGGRREEQREDGGQPQCSHAALSARRWRGAIGCGCQRLSIAVGVGAIDAVRCP